MPTLPDLPVRDQPNDSTDCTDALTAASIAAIRARTRPTNRVSAEFCEDCGGTIPDQRRRLMPGCQMCVDCASRHERDNYRYLRPVLQGE